MTEICGQVNMLKYRIQNLLDQMCKAEDKKKLSKIQLAEYENCLKDCIEYHVGILRFV